MELHSLFITLVALPRFILLLPCYIYLILTKEIDDGWNIFAKVVPRTTAVRGPAALKNRKYFLDFPWLYNINTMSRMLIPKIGILPNIRDRFIPGVSWQAVLQA